MRKNVFKMLDISFLYYVMNCHLHDVCVEM